MSWGMFVLVFATVACSDSPALPTDAAVDRDSSDAQVDTLAPDAGPPAMGPAEVTLPRAVVVGDSIPAWVRSLAAEPLSQSGPAALRLGTTAAATGFPLRFGQGAALLTATNEGQVAVAAEGLELSPASILVMAGADRSESGTIGTATWGPNQIIDLTSDVTIPAGETLTIKAGTTIRLGANVNLLVDGTLDVEGEPNSPVAFIPAGDTAWGGINVSGTANLNRALLARGGNDVSRAFGHSNSQPVIFAPGGRVTFVDSLLADSPGKGISAEGGRVRIERSLVTRMDTGGELVTSASELVDSQFMDFPGVDLAPRDDDNDGVYFAGSLLEGGVPVASTVTNCVFFGGLDDGIDHNGATLQVERSWIEGFAHEGIAGSNGGSLRVTDTALVRNDQGLEAGYGAPEVVGDHLLLIENGVGARFGDSYDWEYEGTLTVTNSVFVGNREHQVWNFLFSTDAPKPDSVFVRDSLVPGGFEGERIIDGEPIFGAGFLLTEESPGWNAGSDGSSLGLVSPRPGLR